MRGLPFPLLATLLMVEQGRAMLAFMYLILDCEKKDAAAVADEMMRQQRTVVHAFFIRQKISTSQHKKRANVDVMEKKKIIIKGEKAHQRPKTSQDCLVCEL